MSDHEASQEPKAEQVPDGPWADLVRQASPPSPETQAALPGWPRTEQGQATSAWPARPADPAPSNASSPDELGTAPFAPMHPIATDGQASALGDVSPTPALDQGAEAPEQEGISGEGGDLEPLNSQSEGERTEAFSAPSAENGPSTSDPGAWGQRVRAKRRKSPWRPLVLVVGGLVGGVALLWLGSKAYGQWAMPTTLKAAGLGDRMSVVVAGLDPTPLPTDAMDKETPYLADVVHLMHLDERAGRAFVLTFPRDTRATLAGVGEGALGDALALGGPAMLSETLSSLTGLEANHQVVMDLDGARSAIKELGAQEVYLPAPLAIVDKAAKFDLKLPAGWLKLGANELLAYAYRKEPGAELERLARQQAILHRYQQRFQSFGTKWWLGAAAERSMATLRTDLTKLGFAGAVQAWAALAPSAITYAILPGTVDAKGRYLINPGQWEALKSRLLTAPSRRSPLEAKATLEILHQGDEAQAQALADRLSNVGFQVKRVAKGPVDPSETVVVDHSRADERSSAVLAALDGLSGGARVVLDPTPAFQATYTLRLGAAFFKQ